MKPLGWLLMPRQSGDVCARPGYHSALGYLWFRGASVPLGSEDFRRGGGLSPMGLWPFNASKETSSMIGPIATSNWLTMARILLAPAIFGFTTWGFEVLACLLYVLGLISDWADGMIARKTGSSSPFGRAMDSPADKVLTAGAIFGMVHREDELFVACAFMLIAREMIVQGLRSIRTSDGAIVAKIDRRVGRARFVFLHAAVVLLLLPAKTQARSLGLAMFVVATFLAYLSLAFYTARDFKTLLAALKKDRDFLDG